MLETEYSVQNNMDYKNGCETFVSQPFICLVLTFTFRKDHYYLNHQSSDPDYMVR